MEVNKNILFALILGILFLAGGTFYYSHTEGWSYTDSFYFSTMTLTTIGYGDFVPTTDESKMFTSFYAIFGIGIMLYLLGSVISTFLINQEKYFERIFSRKPKNEKSK